MAANVFQPTRAALPVPDEVLETIISCLLSRIEHDAQQGHLLGYNTRGFIKARQNQRDVLLSLCRTSRQFYRVSTVFLYRNVVLNKGGAPTKRYLPVGEDEPYFDSGVITMSLFLRTLLERPLYQKRVQTMDCQFFLNLVLAISDEWISGYHLHQVRAWECSFIKECLKGCRLGPGVSAILDHVGLFQEDQALDLPERLFAALMLLTTELREITLPPPPKRRWCLREGEEDDDLEGDAEWEKPDPDEQIQHVNRNSGFYSTLSTLLNEAYRNELLSTKALRKLGVVTFSFVAHFFPINSRGERYVRETEVDSLIDPGYTFRLDACTGLLKAPNLTELVSHADSGLTEIGEDLKTIQIRKLDVTTNDGTLDAAAVACTAWQLSALCIRHANSPTYCELRDESPDWDPPMPEQELGRWETLLLKQADTMRVLDIGSAWWQSRQVRHLTCLANMKKLEHLRIGLPLLNTNEGFLTRPLDEVLPRSLRTLTIHDGFAAHAYGDMGHYDQESSDKNSPGKPRQYRRCMSTALHRFSLVCGQTHPRLRSIMVFGLAPVEGPRYVDKVNEMAARGPRPDEVLVGSEEIVKQFSENGVVLREFFHEQEKNHPFKVVHVLRYS